MKNRPRMRVAVVTLAGALLVSGCSFNLPGQGGERASKRDVDSTSTVRDEEQGLLTGLFTRTPVDLPDAVPVPAREVTVERGMGGVILRATGVAPTQGWFNAALLPDEQPDPAGVLTVRLVAVPPLTPMTTGPERTRLLMVAAFLQELELRNIRAFRVVSAQNSVTLPLPPRPVPPPIDYGDPDLDAAEAAAF